MNTIDFILDLIYPPSCLACGELQTIGTQVPLCPACQTKWEELRRAYCPVCGDYETVCACKPPLLADLIRNVECVHLVPYEQTTVAGSLLLIAKDERLFRLTGFFADELTSALAARGIMQGQERTVITYLPRAVSRKADTGVDQAESLARALGKRLELPVVKAFARRGAPPQKELTADERLRSARRTYRLRKGFSLPEGSTVLLVDDILTTGATMLTGAELLRSAGAGSIVCVCVGRSVESSKKQKK
ncbi:MAG: ComF family protein [Clostridia bacterium]|nr:ComF family protein [Clostridia bacterium]